MQQDKYARVYVENRRKSQEAISYCTWKKHVCGKSACVPYKRNTVPFATVGRKKIASGGFSCKLNANGSV